MIYTNESIMYSEEFIGVFGFGFFGFSIRTTALTIGAFLIVTHILDIIFNLMQFLTSKKKTFIFQSDMDQIVFNTVQITMKQIVVEKSLLALFLNALLIYSLYYADCDLLDLWLIYKRFTLICNTGTILWDLICKEKLHLTLNSLLIGMNGYIFYIIQCYFNSISGLRLLD